MSPSLDEGKDENVIKEVISEGSHIALQKNN